MLCVTCQLWEWVGGRTGLEPSRVRQAGVDQLCDTATSWGWGGGCLTPKGGVTSSTPWSAGHTRTTDLPSSCVCVCVQVAQNYIIFIINDISEHCQTHGRIMFSSLSIHVVSYSYFSGLGSQSLASCLRFTSSPICFSTAAARTSSLRWNSCVTNTPPPASPQRAAACKTYQDLCICIQTLLRWMQRWKRHGAVTPPPHPPLAFINRVSGLAGLTNAAGFKVVICLRFHNSAAVWLSRGGAKRRWRAGSIYSRTCNVVPEGNMKELVSTGEIRIQIPHRKMYFSLHWLLNVHIIAIFRFIPDSSGAISHV